jgi:hypothetical protein
VIPISATRPRDQDLHHHDPAIEIASMRSATHLSAKSQQDDHLCRSVNETEIMKKSTSSGGRGGNPIVGWISYEKIMAKMKEERW